jgi:ABC-type transport system substrate-binding protein
MVGLSSISDKLLQEDAVKLQQAPLTSSVMLFFNNSNEFLKDKNLRQALVYATDSASLRKSIGYSPVPADSPFLKNQFAYNPEITQLPFDLEKANEKFSEAGWALGEDGLREKDGKKLRFRFVSQSLTEYSTITQKLQEDWAKVGVSIDAILQPEDDIQSNALARHDYDIFLYGISIGYDPDVFAYWHTSQIDPNSSSLNLSEYSNEIADEALEAGRTRVDETLRKVKYNPFLSQWREDAPAVALYQPRFVMVTRGTFEGFDNESMSTATDRYWSIADWRIRNSETVKQ